MDQWQGLTERYDEYEGRLQCCIRLLEILLKEEEKKGGEIRIFFIKFMVFLYTLVFTTHYYLLLLFTDIIYLPFICTNIAF